MRKRFTLLLLAFLIFYFLPISAAMALCIDSPRANLRKGPGTHYEILWKVFRYMPFKKLASRGTWIRIQDVDGDIYWVHKKLTTEKFQCAVIKNNKTHLRTGPGTQYEQVSWSPVEKYFSMKVIAIKGNWVHTEDGVGDRAWVYRPLVWIH
ncbi:MAG: hypothetical protein COV67_01490 [Nitrospinae bacterium CG11_big_fil_rev_8_21_14_0_20_56_8]|nr:MAG: hypothetical protein COV67_01490 [Nitrospinae bacterium CG11_big_fil_rev_8_21_14_0_20_56_8]